MFEVLLVITAISFAAAVVFMGKAPRRAVSGFLLEIALVTGFVALLQKGIISLEAAQVILLICHAILGFIGLGLLLNTVLLVHREGFSKINLLPFLFGAASIAVAVIGYHDVVGGMSGSETYVRVMSVLTGLVMYTPFVFIGYLLHALIYPLLPKPKNPDYFVVLGCRIRKDGTVTPLLRGRLKKAVACYHKSDRHAQIIVSGGQGADEVRSEAAAMCDYLRNDGIPPETILMEDKSRNTEENLRFSRALMKGTNPVMLVCTSNYHVSRTAMLMRRLNLTGDAVGGHTALYYLPVAFFRECIAVLFQNKWLFIAFELVTVLYALSSWIF